MGVQIQTQPQSFIADLTATQNVFILGSLSANNINLSPTSVITGPSSTLVDIGALSARSVQLTFNPANDGTVPNLFIGETASTGVSGFNVTYNEINNNLLVTSDFSRRTPTPSLTALVIDSSGNIGVNTTPNNTLTVRGAVSGTGNVVGLTPIVVTGVTSYTVQPFESSYIIASTNSTTGLTATLASAANRYPTGFQVGFLQLSGAQITIVGAGSIVINQANGYNKTSKQFSAATLVNTGAGWVLFGDVGP